MLEGGGRRRRPKVFLENLFRDSVGSNSNVEIKHQFAHRLGIRRPFKSNSRDQDIIIGFSDIKQKFLVVETLWNQPKFVVQGQEITFYLDHCPLTLKKRRSWGFITKRLSRYGNQYRWGYPFHLLVTFKDKTIILKTMQQVK